MSALARAMAGCLVVVGLVLAGCGSAEYERLAPGTLPSDVDEQVARIVKLLSDTGKVPANMKVGSINRLKEYAKAAESALPVLEKLAAEDASQEVRTAATEAIAAIKGGGAPAAAPPAQ